MADVMLRLPICDHAAECGIRIGIAATTTLYADDEPQVQVQECPMRNICRIVDEWERDEG